MGSSTCVVSSMSCDIWLGHDLSSGYSLSEAESEAHSYPILHENCAD